jgi:hypothetical protein
MESVCPRCLKSVSAGHWNRCRCNMFRARTVAAMLIMFMCCVAGCTDAQQSQLGSLGSKFTVTLYSNGESVKTWTSTGKVMTESESDGWYFTDEKTGKLVRVSGSVVIEQQ